MLMPLLKIGVGIMALSELVDRGQIRSLLV